MGSKCGFLNSLPHPPSCSARHPPARWAVGIRVRWCSDLLYPVIAKEYDQRWKRWRTTVAIQGNMSAGIRPQRFFIYWIATLRSR